VVRRGVRDLLEAEPDIKVVGEAGTASSALARIRGTDLVGAVRTVASGQSMLDPRAASQLMARPRDQSTRRDPRAGLSAQERRILELIRKG
jgi:DNA-binding NarL/FixJ family response regulator